MKKWAEGWKRRAWKFIHEQRKQELLLAIARYPTSERLGLRKAELAEIEQELKEIEEAENS